MYSAQADAVAHSLTVPEYQIEKVLRGIDYDGSSALASRIIDHLPQEARVHALDRNRGDLVAFIVDGPIHQGIATETGAYILRRRLLAIAGTGRNRGACRKAHAGNSHGRQPQKTATRKGAVVQM